MASLFNALKKQVKAVIPIDEEMIAKLTLTTPELTAERERIDEEEKRKENVRDYLSPMYPWETRDEEREILVDECKEAILHISTEEERFFGPYKMPHSQVDETLELNHKSLGDFEDKLESLQPLPKLLSDFDLDMHVGLIQKILSVDKHLESIHATLAGAGERERTFWRNYFFHCAFARYEACLSIDEIWSDQPVDPPQAETKIGTEAEDDASQTPPETVITFEAEGPSTEASVTSASSSSDKGDKLFDTPVVVDAPTKTTPDVAGTDTSTDFDLINADGGEDEMDELEAEIARELED